MFSERGKLWNPLEQTKDPQETTSMEAECFHYSANTIPQT